MRFLFSLLLALLFCVFSVPSFAQDNQSTTFPDGFNPNDVIPYNEYEFDDSFGAEKDRQIYETPINLQVTANEAIFQLPRTVLVGEFYQLQCEEDNAYGVHLGPMSGDNVVEVKTLTPKRYYNCAVRVVRNGLLVGVSESVTIRTLEIFDGPVEEVQITGKSVTDTNITLLVNRSPGLNEFFRGRCTSLLGTVTGDPVVDFRIPVEGLRPDTEYACEVKVTDRQTEYEAAAVLESSNEVLVKTISEGGTPLVEVPVTIDDEPKKVSSFTDTSLDTLEGQAAEYLLEEGIIGGYADGSFGGSRYVNRAEAAKFLLLARFGFVNGEGADASLPDVPAGAWFEKYVRNAFARGIMNGYPDGTFKPGNTINTAEFLKMLTKTFELTEGETYRYVDVPRDSWFAPFAGVASRYALFPQRSNVNYLEPGKLMTRSEVAIALYQYMSK